MKKIQKKLYKSILCIALFGTIHLSYGGFSMNPLSMTMQKSKRGVSVAETIVKFVGDTKVPAAVSIKITECEISLDGKNVIYKDNDKISEQFIVFPAQIVLMPQTSQRVQITWAGKEFPQRETIYGVVAEEVPVKIGGNTEGKTTVRLMLMSRYEGVLALQPSRMKPFIIAESAVHDTVQDSTHVVSDRLVMTLYNKGTGRKRLTGMYIMVEGKSGKKITYKPELTAHQLTYSVFAGTRRKVSILWPKEIPIEPVNVKIVKFEK